MKNKFSQKRIPTVYAFAILFISIWVTLLLLKTSINIVGKASPQNQPENIFISNITDASATINYTTREKTSGAISLDGESSNIFFDDRDNNSNHNATFYSHQIEITNLKAQSTYKFSIISEGEVFLDRGQKFTVTTGAVIDGVSQNQEKISGNVLLPNGDPGNDVLLKISSPSFQTISWITNASGNYQIPVSQIRNNSFDNLYDLKEGEEINFDIYYQDTKTNVKTIYKKGLIMPEIILSKNYNFLSENLEIVEGTPSAELKIPKSISKQGEVRIISPKENESFIDSQPLFRGSGIPGEKVKVTIRSQEINEQTIVDSNGTWSFRPSTSLSPGEHLITIETRDSQGITRKLTQSFIVFGSGSQIAEPATPSATPTSLPTQVPTTQPTATTAPIPTLALPTLSPTAIVQLPSSSASPTLVKRVTPASPGNNSSTLILTVVSAIFIFTGATLLLLL